MKYILIFCATVSVLCIGIGIYFYWQDSMLQHKFFGAGSIMLFLVTFPLFLYYRKDKTTMDKYIWKNNDHEKLD